MKRFVEEKKTSAWVRFLMQDVIELKQNGWRKRREDAGPKTIDQIHKEVEKEQMEMKITHMTASMRPSAMLENPRVEHGRRRAPEGNWRAVPAGNP